MNTTDNFALKNQAAKFITYVIGIIYPIRIASQLFSHQSEICFEGLKTWQKAVLMHKVKENNAFLH